MTTSESAAQSLPQGIQLIERGWLSSNQVLLLGQSQTALIDSGYVSHAPQTLALVQQALGGRTLDHLVNTHLHSDHCGGNATLQRTYPNLHTRIAPGDAPFVVPWQAERLSFDATGQTCEPFGFDSLLALNETIQLGDWLWEVLAAPGHDPSAAMLWCPAERILISADALWEHGFGIVFPELVGEAGFEAVEATLRHIQNLNPLWVLPGHGRAFNNVASALTLAYARLERFKSNPASHHQHAVKALLKFILMDWQQCDWLKLRDWVDKASLMVKAMDWGLARGYQPAKNCTPVAWPCENERHEWLASALNQLLQQGVLRQADGTIIDS